MNILYPFSRLVNSMVYYGITLNAVNMAGNPYLNFVGMAAIEIPANAMCIFNIQIFWKTCTNFYLHVIWRDQLSSNKFDKSK